MNEAKRMVTDSRILPTAQNDGQSFKNDVGHRKDLGARPGNGGPMNKAEEMDIGVTTERHPWVKDPCGRHDDRAEAMLAGKRSP